MPIPRKLKRLQVKWLPTFKSQGGQVRGGEGWVRRWQVGVMVARGDLNYRLLLTRGQRKELQIGRLLTLDIELMSNY